MTCDRHGAKMYEPPWARKEGNYVCPLCKIQVLEEEAEELKATVSKLTADLYAHITQEETQ